MTRNEIWTIAGGSGYAGKPRPAVIVQDDDFEATLSITVCLFTTDPTEAPLFRIPVSPSEENGLRTTSSMMADKLTTVSREKLRSRIGKLGNEDAVRLNRAILVFLGLARSRR